FLGFTHSCARARSGRVWIKRITIAKRLRAKLKAINQQLKRRRHTPIPDQGRWLASVLRGHMAYYAVPGNTDAVSSLCCQITRHWFKALRRRSQRDRMHWERMGRIATQRIPQGPVKHPFPAEDCARQPERR